MFQVLQVLEISENWIWQTFGFFWSSKVTSTSRKQQMERDGDGSNNKVYIIVTDEFYSLVHVIIRLDGSEW